MINNIRGFRAEAEIINVPNDYLTVNSAIKHAVDGTVIIIEPGIYVQSETMKINCSLTIASKYLLSREKVYIEETVINGNNLNKLFYIEEGAGTVRFCGLTIVDAENPIYSYDHIEVEHCFFDNIKDDAISFETTGYGSVRSCVIGTTTDDGIDVDAKEGIFNFEYNTIRNCGDNGIEIRFYPFSGEKINYNIINNWLDNNADDGLQLIGYPEITNRKCYISKNIFTDNKRSGLGCIDNDVDGPEVDNFTGAKFEEDVYVYNNTFIGNNHGLTGSYNMIALNNVFYENVVGAKNLLEKSIIDYSAFENNENDIVNCVSGSTIYSSGININDDFLLLEGSTCIDNGVSKYEWNGDIVIDLNNFQYHGEAPDIGAYEYHEDNSTIYVPVQYSRIQKAIDMASDSMEILVAPDVYNENIIINNKKIVLSSWYEHTENKQYIDQTIINGDGGEYVVKIMNSETDTLKIQGFSIQNADDGIQAFSKFTLLNSKINSCNDGIDYEAGGGGVCRFNEINSNKDDGIDLDDDVEIVIEHNDISGNSDDGIEIRLHQYSGAILNYVINANRISNNSEDGIQLVDYPDLSDRFFYISNNIIYENAISGIGCMDNGNSIEDGVGGQMNESVVVVNNTFYNNKYGITGGNDIFCYNNIISQSNTGIKNVNGFSKIGFNCLWKNYENIIESNFPQHGMLYQDPLFEKPHNGNFNLLRNSPCIDAGTTNLVRKNYDDYNDNERISDGNDDGINLIDIGAIEFYTSGKVHDGSCFVCELQ